MIEELFGFELTQYFDHSKEELPPPERDGKPITCDGLLFAEKEKLFDYLGPDDPIVKNWK